MDAYVAAGIAASRVKNLLEHDRDRMLQDVQLEGGLCIYESEGEVEARIDCPACDQDRDEALFEETRRQLELMAGPEAAALLDRLWSVAGTIAVKVPYGLKASRGNSPAGPLIHAEKLDDETLVWAVRQGVLTLRQDSKAISALDASKDREVLEMLPRVGAAIELREVDVLSRATDKAIREAAGS